MINLVIFNYIVALKGIKVIEFAGLAPVPFCGKVLRDLGARVIRIDKYGSNLDQDRLSHDKESISINLKQKQGIEIVKKLTNNADVLIEPFRKGVMERLGLGPEVICSQNPRLIYARLTGYGQYGELSDRAGHDINYVSYSGVLSTLGRKTDKPYAPINLVADFAGGGLMCALAIISRLYQREKKDKAIEDIQNRVIDCSMVEGAAYLSTWLWTSKSLDIFGNDLPGVWSESGERGTNLLDGGYHAYDTYETKDGLYMAVGSLEPKFYELLLKGLNLNDTSIDITKEVIEKELKKKTQKEWIEIFKDSDACVSPVLKLDEAPMHPHNKERNSFIVRQNNNTNNNNNYKSDSTNTTQILPNMAWLNLDNKNNSRKFEMPLLGQHTSSILKELNYSQDEINKLVNEKVVSVPKLSKL